MYLQAKIHWRDALVRVEITISTISLMYCYFVILHLMLRAFFIYSGAGAFLIPCISLVGLGIAYEVCQDANSTRDSRGMVESPFRGVWASKYELSSLLLYTSVFE